MTYLLEAAPPKTTAEATASKLEGDATLVVFCVDVSGSMSSIADLGDGTISSRLRAAQAAVTQQLEVMSKETPNRRAVLITFESDVHIYGDGIFARFATCYLHYLLIVDYSFSLDWRW